MVREMHIKLYRKKIFHLLDWQKYKDLKCFLFIGKTVGKTSPLIILLVGIKNGISAFRGETSSKLYMFTFDLTISISILGIDPKDTLAKI